MLIRTSLLWGLYLGIATSLGTQILTWMGLGLTSWFVVLTAALLVLFVALALSRIKSRNSGKLKFTDAIISVFLMVLIARYVFQFYMFVYINYIDPSWVDTVATTWSASLQESGMASENIEKTINGFREAWDSTAIFTTEVVKHGLPQLILGLLVSLFFVFRKSSGN